MYEKLKEFVHRLMSDFGYEQWQGDESGADEDGDRENSKHYILVASKESTWLPPLLVTKAEDYLLIKLNIPLDDGCIGEVLEDLFLNLNFLNDQFLLTKLVCKEKENTKDPEELEVALQIVLPYNEAANVDVYKEHIVCELTLWDPIIRYMIGCGYIWDIIEGKPNSNNLPKQSPRVARQQKKQEMKAKLKVVK